MTCANRTGLSSSTSLMRKQGGHVVAKKKTWGDEGFTTTIQYGAYSYTIKFVPEEEIKKFIHSDDDGMTCFGGVNCFKQTILICANTTLQTQKATVLHELVHVILLRNGNLQDEYEEQKNIQSEELVDGMALGIMELMRRNPELVRWLMKE